MAGRGLLVTGLAVAFAALVLEPVIADALDQFSVLAVALFVSVGLGLVWRSLDG